MWAFAVVVLVNLWYTYPFFMVTLLGGLQSIPHETVRGGGGGWRQLVATVDQHHPAPAAAGGSADHRPQLAHHVQSRRVRCGRITQGGPIVGAGKPGATEFVMVHAYKQIFQTQAFGRMGAFAVILFVALFAATLYSLRITQITKGAYE